MVALMTPEGRIVERVVYDPYGRGRHHFAADYDGNGAVEVPDLNGTYGHLTAWFADDMQADWDRNGTTYGDVPDIFAFQTDWFAQTGNAVAAGQISRRYAAGSGINANAPDNMIGYCGYVFNPETDDYTVRFRHYDPEIGRWLQRDPAKYIDGMNLGQYVRGRAPNAVDPSGLMTPEEFARMTAAQQKGWIRRQDAKFLQFIERSAARHCIPRDLLRAMILNEMMDYSVWEALGESLGRGSSVGPAQITVQTALDEEVLDDEQVRELYIRMYLQPWGRSHELGPDVPLWEYHYRQYLSSREGGIEAAAALVAKYLADLCSKLTEGTVSASFSALATGTSSKEVCCMASGSPDSARCATIYDSAPSTGLLRAMAAMWNNGRRITAVESIPTKSPNAFRHAQNAAALANYNEGKPCQCEDN
ncbi:MAG: RHS repeat-associated core domain-containing protein [Phycisphaeraceae bacterium]|nr:RHS repeat-associated core domain-containing protein [Phycisphaeraceae bacterium]